MIGLNIKKNYNAVGYINVYVYVPNVPYPLCRHCVKRPNGENNFQNVYIHVHSLSLLHITEKNDDKCNNAECVPS